MRATRDFDIDIYNLGNKVYVYDYDLNSDFFAAFEDSYIHKGNLKVRIELDKSETLMIAKFRIEGHVELICDRSNEPFDFSIDTTNKIIFKYGEDFAELTDEIVTIPHSTQKLNMAQYIYEFVGLAIPMKKLHPRFVEESDNDDNHEETLLIYTTGAPAEETSAESDVDPRWKILNGLKHNNN